MKNIIATLFITCFFLAIGHSQIGIRGGLNQSTIQIEFEGLTATPGSRINFQGGITYDIPMGKKSLIRLNALYSGKGYKLQVDDEDFKSEQKISTAFVEIPVSYVYFLNTPEEESASSGLYFEGGLYVGMLLSANEVLSETVLNADPMTEERDVKEEFNDSDFGVNFGIGYRFQENISVGLNYGLGLGNLIPEDQGGDEISANNKVLSLYAIYHL